MDWITLRFDSKTLDYIATCLGQRPYAEVQSVLADIGRQVAMHNAERDTSQKAGTAVPSDVVGYANGTSAAQ